MNRESLIRRMPEIAFAALLVAGVITGGPDTLAGLPRFLQAAMPGMAAQASPDTGLHTVAHFTLTGFEESRFAPQVLYPVATNPVPDWLAQAIQVARLGAPPALRGVKPAQVPTAARPVIAICIDDLGEDIAGTD